MSIPRQIRSRAVEAVILFIKADPDFGPLLGDGARVFRQPYDEMGAASVSMAPAPRQAHIYAGGSLKEPGVGDAWDRDFEVMIEWYSPRNELPPAMGAVSVDDEIDYLVTRLYAGEAPRSPGRFRDPDNVGQFITTKIRGARVTVPKIAAGEAAMRRDISIIFSTRENAEGERV